MGYRRDRQDAAERRRWRAFVQQHGELLADAGIVTELLSDYRAFQYFAMHGAHPDFPHAALPTHAQLNEVRRSALRRVIEAYFAAGLPDPGFTLLSAEEVERAREAGRASAPR